MTTSIRATVAPAATVDTTLADARFIDLVTFRRTGEPVGTPVLFVRDGDRLLVRTAAGTGKLKRLAQTARIEVTPCDQRGRHLGQTTVGEARVLGPEQVGDTLSRLHRRYRIAGPLSSFVRHLRGQRDVIIEIQLAAGIEATEPVVAPVVAADPGPVPGSVGRSVVTAMAAALFLSA